MVQLLSNPVSILMLSKMLGTHSAVQADFQVSDFKTSLLHLVQEPVGVILMSSNSYLALLAEEEGHLLGDSKKTCRGATWKLASAFPSWKLAKGLRV